MGKVATEATLQKAVDLLHVIVEGQVTSTPAEIQDLVQRGLAKDHYAVGDIINIEWTDKSPTTPVTYIVPHVVVHYGDVYDKNNVLHKDAMYLMWMYATPQVLAFDAPEQIVADEETFQSGYHYYIKNGDDFVEQTVTVGNAIPNGTTYYKHVRTGMSGRLRYGSNNWAESAYRQWLNSSAGKGEWWSAQHASDVAPAQASSLPGFLSGYSDDWLAVFKPVRVTTALNTVCDDGVDIVTYDKFFLPSIEQMYGVPQKSGVEGEYWEYWKNEIGLNSPTNGTSTNVNDARMITHIGAPNGAAVAVRLRSASRSNTNYVWYCHSAGYLNHTSANSVSRAQPACVIF